MKTISFKEGFEILAHCSAVIWGDGRLSYPCLDDEEHENLTEDRFLELLTDDSEGNVFEANFYKGMNQNIRVVGSSMFLFNEYGEEVQLIILVPANLTPDITHL